MYLISLHTVLETLFWLWLFYAFFLAYTAIYRAKKQGRFTEIGWLAKGLGYSYIVVGGLLDIAFNVTLGTLVFAEAPTTWTVTQRCKKHINDSGFRGRFARYVCARMLDPFQEGGHC